MRKPAAPADPAPHEPIKKALNKKKATSLTDNNFFKGMDQRLIDGSIHLTGFAALRVSDFNHWCDNFFMNGGFDRSCDGIKGSGSLLSRIQTGRAQDYLLFVAVGMILLFGLLHLLLGR